MVMQLKIEYHKAFLFCIEEDSQKREQSFFGDDNKTYMLYLLLYDGRVLLSQSFGSIAFLTLQLQY